MNEALISAKENGFDHYIVVSEEMFHEMQQYVYAYRILRERIDPTAEIVIVSNDGNSREMTKDILHNAFGIHEKWCFNAALEANDEFDHDFCTEEELLEACKLIKIQAIMNVDFEERGAAKIYQTIDSVIGLSNTINIATNSEYFSKEIHFRRIVSQVPEVQIIECCSREIYCNHVKGNVAEAGVYRGETAKYINLLFPDRQLYLFDTFAGFDSRDMEADRVKNIALTEFDFSDTSERIVLEKMPYPNRCIIKKGWFPESAGNLKDTFCFVRLDFDLYEPIYAGLNYFYERMEKGGYILVHDCRAKSFMGARQAVMDFCKEKHLGYMCMQDYLGTAVINIGF